MGQFSGKGAVVTGGTRGIGRAIVERLAAEGATVVFNYAHSAEAAADVERAVGGGPGGSKAYGIRVDLARRGAAAELMAAADEMLDGLDILVNNAAAEFTPTSLAATDEELYDAAMEVNARSTFLTMRHAARTMRDNGRVINISTLNTTRPAPGTAAYAASKGAVEQLTKVAATELGPRGITVNAVCPGATDTDLLRGTNPAESLEQVARLTPLRRLGQPDDIASVVALLAGPDGRWLTGQLVHATGGIG
ncbi:SDR family oxidoreductase [Streptomyces sp. Z26]|uniref:SDR family NAD(P)-dependent oxidoreductase n=1 Tax=Streptomyces TaxID=1883 RepID=UPI000EF1748E|nr:SDR family oxidoreductase [Streptomyces sp. Z26]RLL68984.1 SDR family oxidoreductase [Streptomyces sp. Z26]